MEYLLLVLGFMLLLFGGRFLVTGGVALAERLNVSSLVIGLTVVSFGTSAPELFVSAVAAIKGSSAVVVGNVIGSNIANIALVLAITAMIFPITVRSNSVKTDAPFMLIVSFLLWGFMLNKKLTLFEGIFFLILLATYTYGLIFFSRRQKNKEDNPVVIPKMSLRKTIILLLMADIALAIGADLLVDNAGKLAINFGIPPRIIAITVVAFGTSLPELATSIIAAFRKEMDISIGNIIGSNIFNILGVLGISSVIKNIGIEEGFLSNDIFWMMGISVLLFLFILPFEGGRINRTKGGILFILYCIYVYKLYF